MVIKATYYGANGWLIDLDETRILIDPWLKGDLTFPPGDWLIKGKLDREIEVPIDIDFLLLTQGQADHAHLPTLEKINKGIPVIASQAARNVVKQIGFTKIHTLKPGEIFKNKPAPIPTIINKIPIITGGVAISDIEPKLFPDEDSLVSVCEVSSSILIVQVSRAISPSSSVTLTTTRYVESRGVKL